MTARSKKCKVCKNVFKPFYSTTQQTCSIQCAAKLAKEKEGKKVFKQMKEELISTKDLLKILTLIFNKFIRLRDKDLPCISCGKTKSEDWHAGHYLPSTYSYLRYNELNVNRQCSECNTHLSGNLVFYRKGLINKIGIKKVEWLEDVCRIEWKPSKEEIKKLIDIYKNKVKDYAAR